MGLRIQPRAAHDIQGLDSSGAKTGRTGIRSRRAKRVSSAFVPLVWIFVGLTVPDPPRDARSVSLLEPSVDDPPTK